MAEILPEVDTSARIRVLGIGGGGTSAVERMIRSQLQGIEFVAINTDAQALLHSHAPRKIHIGQQTTRGLGAGADPEVGRRAAEESEKDVQEAVKGADMVFITLGEGGGTGTGAAPLVAEAAREAGALVVGIVTKPFTFEGERRRRSAEAGIEALKGNVDTLITIPNDRLLQMIDRKTSLVDAFGIVDDVLQQGVQGISDLITVHGLINLDFADVKAIMSGAGSALMGIGRASGDNRAIEATRQAIDSPLLEVSIEGARGVLLNVTGGRNMTMHEIDEAAKTISDAVDPDANIIFGAVLDETLEDDIKITVVATGFDTSSRREKLESTPGTQTQTHQRPLGESVAIADPESIYEPEVAPLPVTIRQPFINERPQAAEPLEEVIMPKVDPPQQHAPRRFPPIASIEPDPVEDEAARMKPTAISSRDFLADEVPESSILDDEPTPTAKASHRVTTSEQTEDDDLDIPAFIRRKVE